MFRVKIDLGAMRHHEIKKSGAGASDRLEDRLGDWAEELAKPHPQLTKEDLCRTFHEKFHDGCNRDTKTVA
ncbi:hypothetical protein [Celeribacter ethanolicus]|uniref:hypothetical protein n=1 Tax=Celeribacter ethanolicus TaxID=1758178 RepID=UPI0008312EBE|nr:hypothetical protein [Celeribacter ethanolicus]TNE68124.1 MAG: hypothetical protein EP336_05830 [Paracoccaceae bacterium]